MTTTLPVTLHEAGRTWTGTLTLTPITHDSAPRSPYHAAYKVGLKALAAPDYSTPEKVTARCRERGSGDWGWLAASRDTTFAKLYRSMSP